MGIPLQRTSAYRRQNAHLTFRHNRDQGRHGWLRLTPAYSVTLVAEIVSALPKKARLLDPFSGTATTTLCAVTRGHEAVSVDINPFLVWLGNAKLARYSRADLAACERVAGEVAASVRAGSARACVPPPIHNIDRWWHQDALAELCQIRREIDARAKPKSRAHDLLLIAFCRAAIESSSAAFHHQSMSFRSQDAQGAMDCVTDLFLRYLGTILDTAAERPAGRGKVVSGDARNLSALGPEERFNAVVTSPPYANRMSYIRELRPYMYWTGFLSSAREAGELDWEAIGGTWGVATSRLKEWSRDRRIWLPRSVDVLAQKIASAGEKHAELMASYVTKYFQDAAAHLSALVPRISPGGEVHYIVGNSKFYDVVVPTHELYAELMAKLGVRDVAISVLRKRNSKKELFEYDVTGRCG